MDEDKPSFLSFHEMGLDDRILKAVAKLGWSQPTPIQERAIPLSLEGKDVLARARTGSGKTAAFAIPVIQKILQMKPMATEQIVRALVLTPSKELCSQAYRNILELTSCCSREVTCADISPQHQLNQQRPVLMEKPDIVVGTPSRVLAHIRAGNLTLKHSMEMLIIDEADLLFSFGYQMDMKELLSHLPKIYQAFLMSATLSEDVKVLKKMILHNAVILKLEESHLPEATQLTQYHIKCEDEDKFALIYTLIKLRLIRGKSIIFVNAVNQCYRLKLFLEQFAIPSCVLNSELPTSSRCHIVTQFNDGLYDIIIASDETLLADPKETPQHIQKGKKTRKKDEEYGVSRGIDFRHVSNVVNFDFPITVNAYIHRVGRTARGDNQGTALSFISVKEMKLLEEVEASLSDSYGDGENVFKPFQFKMEEIEGFRYRAKDALRAVTKIAVREARRKEIKYELLNSQKLKSYFEDNPRDLQLLRHDKNLHTVKVQPQLKNVPDYLVPQTLRSMGRSHTRSQGQRTRSAHAGSVGRGQTGSSRGQRRYQKRQADPLKCFEFAGLSQKKKRKR